MSTTYPYYSNVFPDDIDNFDPFEDPDSSSLPLMNLYYSYIENNDIDGALGVLDRNPDLKTKIINADRLNLLRDSLLSIEQYYKDNIENIDNVFIATYGNAGATGVTTSAEIEAAYQAGKACFCVYNGRCYALSYRANATNHYFSVFYSKSRFTVRCANNQWSTGTESFASSDDLSSGLSTKQDNLPSQTGNNGKYLTTNGSSLSWGDVPNGVFVVEYGATDTGMIDAYNEGQLVIMKYNLGSASAPDYWYYYLHITSTTVSSTDYVFYHNNNTSLSTVIATYNSTQGTLSWGQESSQDYNFPIFIVAGDTTTYSFSQLENHYPLRICYCYYNGIVYFLTYRNEDANNISYYFTSVNNGVQYTAICNKNLSNNTITWNYTSSSLPVYATCSTGTATTVARVATTTNGNFVLTTGAQVNVKFTYGNTASTAITLNVDNTGAKTIYRSGTSTTRYYWQAGELITFVYDGTYWVMQGKSTASTTYYGVTKLETSSTSTSTSTALTPSSLNSFALYTVSGLPVYSSSNTYAVGDKVRYGNSMYVCNTAITSGESWTSAHWTQLPSLLAQIENLAPLNSPEFTGNPKVPTPLANADNAQIVNKGYVTNAIASASTTGNIFIAPWGQNGSAVKGAYDAGKTVILTYNPTGTEWSNSTIYMYLQNITESPSSESTQYIRYYFYGVGARTTSLNVANPCRAWFGNLRYNTTSNAYSWTNPIIVSPDTFVAVYGSTTNDELVDAYNNHQNITLIYDVTSTQQHYVAPLVFANVGSTNSIWDFACIIGTSSPTRHWFRLNQTGTWSTGTNTLATT